MPTNSKQIAEQISTLMSRPAEILKIHQLLEKIAQQNIIELKNVSIKNEAGYEIIQVHNEKLHYHYHEILSEKKSDEAWADYENSGSFEEEPPEKKVKESTIHDTSDIMSLLSLPSTKEKQSKQVGEEILELLSKPTAKERHLTEKFKSQGGTQVMEFCPHGTRFECMKAQQLVEDETVPETPEEKLEKPAAVDVEIIDEPKDSRFKCNRLHFKKIIQSHTDVVLGDCSFLNTCFHMSTCKYVHYQVDNAEQTANKALKSSQQEAAESSQVLIPKRIEVTLNPSQWIQCDLRYLDMSCLGKFAVIMADPPWDSKFRLTKNNFIENNVSLHF